MDEITSTKIINIDSKSFSDFKKLNIEKLGLNKIKDSNIFEYNSKVFNVLNYKIKSNLIFEIFYQGNNIHINLQSIKGIPELIKKNITLKIKVDIYQKGKSCEAKRFISLNLNKDSFFLKLLSDEITKKFTLNILEVITKRFDKKFLNKVLYS